MGFELRCPDADYLRDGIYELRMRQRHVNYRLLYFFHGNTIGVLAAGLTKEDIVPPAEIERAIRRKNKFALDPKKHGCDALEGLQ
jgi:putative component of toxin-antitoxin plasmid stabilization module